MVTQLGCSSAAATTTTPPPPLIFPNLEYSSFRTGCNSSRLGLKYGLLDSSPPIIHKFPCLCGLRLFTESATLISALPPPAPIPDSSKLLDRLCGVHNPREAVLDKFHPPKPDWYEELFAWFMDKSMNSYEAEVWGYKSQLFDLLRGNVKDILEIGIGTGPNLKFYAGDVGINVIGADPNKKMEKYAKASAEAAGLPSANFQFVQSVGEALPLADASVDVVIGTLVLCSVKDVKGALEEIKRVLRPGGFYLFLEHVAAKDGTLLRFVQKILSPFHQLVSDGCRLTRETGDCIKEAGFSELQSNTVFIWKALFVNPQIYGIARK